jgi:photosystem II stability/assembly factor-like uncharacterized protein
MTVMYACQRALLRLVAAVGVAGVVSGCVSGPAPAAVQLPEGDGIALVKLVTNPSFRRDGPAHLSFIQLQSLQQVGDDPTSSVGLGRVDGGTDATAIFAATLKAGRYRIVKARGSLPDIVFDYPLDHVFDTFEVRRGEVTLLGTWMMLSTAPRRFRLGYLPPDAELRESFERLFPLVTEQVRGKDVLALDMTPALQAAAADTLGFSRNFLAVNGLWQDARGDFYAGSRLGKVLRRPVGTRKWQELDLGTRREVLTVRPYAGGLLAGGEEGLLRFSDNGGKTWVSLAPPAWGVIHTLEVLGDGRVAAVVRVGTEWTVFVSEDPRKGAWRSLGVVYGRASRSPPSIFAAHGGSGWWPPCVVFTPGQVSVMNREGSLYSMDLSTAKVTQNFAHSRMMRLSAAGDGTLVMHTEAMFQGTQLSTDSGLTWTDLKGGSGLPVFRDRQHGYLVKRSSVMATRDAGKTWTEAGEELPWKERELKTVAIDRIDGSLLAVSYDGAVWRSADEGGSWTRER